MSNPAYNPEVGWGNTLIGALGLLRFVRHSHRSIAITFLGSLFSPFVNWFPRPKECLRSQVAATFVFVVQVLIVSDTKFELGIKEQITLMTTVSPSKYQ